MEEAQHLLQDSLWLHSLYNVQGCTDPTVSQQNKEARGTSSSYKAKLLGANPGSLEITLMWLLLSLRMVEHEGA